MARLPPRKAAARRLWRNRKMRRLLAILIFIGFATSAFAASSSTGQKSVGTFGNWHAYQYRENKQDVCYMTANVPFAKIKKFKRGSSYIMITHRPAENTTDVISYTTGYNLKPGKDLILTIDKKSFSLFTDKDTGWAREPHTDHAIAAAIRSGVRMKITGFPSAKTKGITSITDTFELKGASSAYQAIGKACGLTGQPGEKHKKPGKRAVP